MKARSKTVAVAEAMPPPVAPAEITCICITGGWTDDLWGHALVGGRAPYGHAAYLTCLLAGAPLPLAAMVVDETAARQGATQVDWRTMRQTRRRP
jgi:hypothetical protein